MTDTNGTFDLNGLAEYRHERHEQIIIGNLGRKRNAILI